MSAAKRPQPPKLASRLALASQEQLNLSDLEEFSDLLLDRPDFSSQRAAQVVLRSLHCKEGSWGDSNLHGVRCSDVRFTRCDLANATWEQLIAHRVEFTDCQLIGWNAQEAHLQNVLFQGCNLQFVGLRFVACKMVRFEQCDLRNADFQRADLSGVVFHKCDLSNAQLSGTTLKGTDFRGSTIEKLRVGIQELAGAIVEPLQAAYIAGLLGVVIKHEHEE